MLFSNKESAHILARVLNITTNAKRKYFCRNQQSGTAAWMHFSFLTKPSLKIHQLLVNRKFKKNKECSKTACYDMRNSKDAELETSERQDKVSESLGRLAKTQQIKVKRTDSKKQTEAQKQKRESKRERQLKCGVLRQCSHTMTQHFLCLSHALIWQGKSPLLTSDGPRVCLSVCECVCLCVSSGVLVVSWTALSAAWLQCAPLQVSEVVTVLDAVNVPLV